MSRIPKRPRVGFQTTGPSLTKQNFKDEADVNFILKKYEKTGVITHLNEKTGVYGDFSNAQDFKSSLDTVMRAEQSFQELPADVRKLFSNDPAELIAFLDDDKNYDRAHELGLISEERYQASRPKKPEPELKKNDE